MSRYSRGNVLILGAQVPFTRGGAELLIEGLCRELRARDYFADIVALPFSAQPISKLLKQVALWRTLDLSSFAGRDVDLVIGTKFPTYAVQHPAKSVWLIHQHRQLYDLYGTRYGDFSTGTEDEALRQILMTADRKSLEECQSICTISKVVGDRLSRFSGIESKVLQPPLPFSGKYYSSEKKPYILSVGRLCSIKRVDLIVKALPKIDTRLELKIVGEADEPGYDEYLQSEIEKHKLHTRVQMLGRVGAENLLQLFAEAFAVFYAPYDEDYGFVTLEACSSGSPVVTANDSGSVLSFIEHESNGLVVGPSESEIAGAFNRLLDEPELTEKLRQRALSTAAGETWDTVVEELTSPLYTKAASSNCVNS